VPFWDDSIASRLPTIISRANKDMRAKQRVSGHPSGFGLQPIPVKLTIFVIDPTGLGKIRL